MWKRSYKSRHQALVRRCRASAGARPAPGSCLAVRRQYFHSVVLKGREIEAALRVEPQSVDRLGNRYLFDTLRDRIRAGVGVLQHACGRAVKRFARQRLPVERLPILAQFDAVRVEELAHLPPCVAARPIAASPTQNLGPRWRKLGTLDAAQRNLTRVGAPPSSDDPAECVADKGYHARAVLKDLDDDVEDPDCRTAARGASRAGTATRMRAGRFTTTARGCAQRWGSRPCANGRNWSSALCAHPGPGWDAPDVAAGPGNVHKRYLIHVAGHNLGLLMPGQSLEVGMDSGTGLAVVDGRPRNKRGWPWRRRHRSGP